MTLIGWVTVGLGTVANIPQLIKILKNKSAKDVSVSMYIILLILYALFLIQEDNLFLKITFGSVILICIGILLSIWKYKNAASR